eukprot:COSAG01_NODE_51946_length_350_cov_1.597610_1_plen_34_part_10
MTPQYWGVTECAHAREMGEIHQLDQPLYAVGLCV